MFASGTSERELKLMVDLYFESTYYVLGTLACMLQQVLLGWSVGEGTLRPEMGSEEILLL